jgi:hypothetical protein
VKLRLGTKFRLGTLSKIVRIDEHGLAAMMLRGLVNMRRLSISERPDHPVRPLLKDECCLA